MYRFRRRNLNWYQGTVRETWQNFWYSMGSNNTSSCNNHVHTSYRNQSLAPLGFQVIPSVLFCSVLYFRLLTWHVVSVFRDDGPEEKDFQFLFLETEIKNSWEAYFEDAKQKLGEHPIKELFFLENTFFSKIKFSWISLFSSLCQRHISSWISVLYSNQQNKKWNAGKNLHFS